MNLVNDLCVILVGAFMIPQKFTKFNPNNGKGLKKVAQKMDR